MQPKLMLLLLLLVSINLFTPMMPRAVQAFLPDNFEQNPTPTPITPLEHLTTREPTLQQVEAFLTAYPPGKFGDEACRFYWLESTAPLMYVDLNGDDALDLLVEGQNHVAAMVWTGEEYSEPFQIHFCRGFRNPWSQVSLEDWTNDGIPEIVFDYRDPSGGSGQSDEIWWRFLIHCGVTNCDIAWYGEAGEFYVYSYIDSFIDGIMLRKTQFFPHFNQDVPAFETVTYEFAFHCTYNCFLNHDVPIPDGAVVQEEPYRVGSVILTKYGWNGSTFEQVEERALTKPHVMQIPTQTTAEYADMTVSVVETPVEMGGAVHYPECQLMVNDTEVGEPFLCLFPFVQWLDVTGDHAPEVVVTAYAAYYGAQETDDRQCAHQRMIIINTANGDPQQIANIIGCIWQPDLFGVRLENVDADAALEVIAGGERMMPDCCGIAGLYWYELNDYDDVYDWDGSGFSWMKSIIRPPYGAE